MYPQPPVLSAPLGCPDGGGKGNVEVSPQRCLGKDELASNQGWQRWGVMSPSEVDVCWPGLLGEISRALAFKAADPKRAMLGPCSLSSSGTCSPQSALTPHQSRTWLTLGCRAVNHLLLL